MELIAHTSAGTDTVTRNEARLFFTMRLQNWPGGTLVKVFVLPDNHPLHRRFANEVLSLFPYQLRRVWDRQLFSGTGQSPTTVSSEQEMLDRVAATPGAIGYVGVPVTHPDIRVLKVR
jgi:ABC-type phosphate transport system substrate-binding protein